MKKSIYVFEGSKGFRGYTVSANGSMEVREVPFGTEEAKAIYEERLPVYQMSLSHKDYASDGSVGHYGLMEAIEEMAYFAVGATQDISELAGPKFGPAFANRLNNRACDIIVDMLSKSGLCITAAKCKFTPGTDCGLRNWHFVNVAAVTEAGSIVISIEPRFDLRVKMEPGAKKNVLYPPVIFYITSDSLEKMTPVTSLRKIWVDDDGNLYVDGKTRTRSNATVASVK